jgi:hypothetical protein
MAAVIQRLREVFGPETASGHSTLRWWVAGADADCGVAIWLDTAPVEPQKCCVLWVSRPGEAQDERCPINSFEHLDGFLALVSIARRSHTPVHGHVCPGTN